MLIKTKNYIFILICLVSCFTLQGQEKSQRFPLTEVLAEIATAHSITFNYKSGLLDNVVVLPIQNNLSLSEKLKNLGEQTDLVFKKISDAIITISKPIKVCGYVKDEFSQQPLLGATINGKFDYAISDENGYFELDLESSDELVTIRYLGFKTINQNGDFFKSKICETIIMVEQQEMISAVVLQTYLIQGINKKEDWTTSIDYSRFSLLPGLIESDVLQTVQALPSIASADETVSNINIRGGSNDQNLLLWDDIKMYQTGHFFGLISSFNPNMTQTAAVINNGTDVSYSDGTSGTIHMKTDDKINTKFSGNFGVNFLNAELFSDIPLGNKSSLQVASRKSIDNLVRTPTYEVYFDRVAQNTEAQENESEVSSSNQKFDFYDTSLRWLYNPTERDFLRFNFILINNDLSFDESSNNEDTTSSRQSSISQNSMAFGLNYKRQWNAMFSSTLSVYNTDYELHAVNADVIEEQLFLQENSVSETRIKFDNTYKKNLWQLKLGYDFTETEVINLNDIDKPRFVRRDEEIIREHGAYGQVWFSNENKDFSIRGGIRANYITKFEKLIIEPRLSVRKALGNHFEIEALGEFKHQSTSQIVNFQNDFLGIEKRRWQLADNNDIPIIESKQASIGIMYNNNGWLLDAKGYYKTVDGITTQSQSFTTKYEFEKEKGSYDAYGFEFLFRKKFNRLNSWLSYSYLNNIYTFENLEETEFPSNFDITHAFTLGSTYSTRSWDISAGANYRIGKPTSIPLAGNEVDNNNVNYDLANNQRLDNYLRIDASTLYKFKISKRFRSEVGASVWNILDKENPINNYYRVNDENNSVKFSRFSLGMTTNLVFRILF